MLNVTEIVHLFDLAHSHNRHPVRRPEPGTERVPDGVQTMIDHLVGAAAVVHNRRPDLVVANDLGRALYSDLYEHHRQPNLARYALSDDRAQEFNQDWDIRRLTSRCQSCAPMRVDHSATGTSPT